MLPVLASVLPPAAPAAPAEAAAEAAPAFVHYLPVGTTLISAAFLIILLARASNRFWAPHLVWWAVGVFFYGVGTTLESTITLAGNTPELTRAWYIAGAILGGYPLGTGSAYLLLPRKWAHILTGLTLPLVVATSVFIVMSPLNLDALEPHRPTGDVIGWQWVRALTPIINLYAAVFLIGGAVRSSVRFFVSGNNRGRAIGTALIALGGLLPGIGGGMAKAGHVEWLYVGEFLGLILIWIGYEACIRAPKPDFATEANTAQPNTAQPGTAEAKTAKPSSAPRVPTA